MVESKPEIKCEDITIANEYLNGNDEGRCKAALWAAYNILRKIEIIHFESRKNANINLLYDICKSGIFKDENKTALVFDVKNEIRHAPVLKKDLEKYRFVFDDFIFPEEIKLSKNPNLSKVKQFTLTHESNDYADVIFGLKLFVDIIRGNPDVVNPEIYFRNGDISITFATTDVKQRMVEQNETKSEKEKDVKWILATDKCKIISDTDKEFIITFNEHMNKMGYDYGGKLGLGDGWGGKFQFIYTKTGTKARSAVARIYVWEDKIKLRLFFTNIDKHRTYIENAPPHIKDAFVFKGGDCKLCNANFCTGKKYTIDGNEYFKCNHSMAYFYNPSVEMLSDYMALFMEFYPYKEKKNVK